MLHTNVALYIMHSEASVVQTQHVLCGSVCVCVCCVNCRRERGAGAAGQAAQRCVAQCVAVLVVKEGAQQVQATVTELLQMLKSADPGACVHVDNHSTSPCEGCTQHKRQRCVWNTMSCVGVGVSAELSRRCVF